MEHHKGAFRITSASQLPPENQNWTFLWMLHHRAVTENGVQYWSGDGGYWGTRKNAYRNTQGDL